MSTLLLIIFGILILEVLVIAHEYGHFLVAKRNKVEVEEFGLGFPPRIVSKKIGRGIFRSRYSFNLLPLGGFVRLKGEHDSDRGPGSYGQLNLGAKARVLLAGVGVNLFIGWLILLFLAFVGLPHLLPTKPFFENERQFIVAADTRIDRKLIVYQVFDSSPAQEAGLAVGDRILAINGQSVNKGPIQPELNFLKSELEPFADQEVEFTIQRSGQVQSVLVRVNSEEIAKEVNQAGDQNGLIGVTSSHLISTRHTWSAPIVATGVTFQYVKVTVVGIFKALSSWLVEDKTDEAKELVGGPISIIYFIQSAARYSWELLLLIIALISISLAVMNSLPVPALDGGRLLLTIIFNKIFKRPVDRKTESWAIGISFALLIVLMIIVSIVDFGKFFIN